MASDSVRPSSLSLRTSFLKSAVSRPTRAARSGARTVGLRSIRSSVSRVHAPYADAASRRSSRALIVAISSASGTAARSASRGSGPAYASPIRQAGSSERADSAFLSAPSEGAPARRASSARRLDTLTCSRLVTSITPTPVRIRVPTTTRGLAHRRNARSSVPALIAASSAGRIIMGPACQSTRRMSPGWQSEGPADAGQRAEPHRLGPTVLQHAEVDHRDPDPLGELGERHAAVGEHLVEVDRDAVRLVDVVRRARAGPGLLLPAPGHQMVASTSRRIPTACPITLRQRQQGDAEEHREPRDRRGEDQRTVGHPVQQGGVDPAGEHEVEHGPGDEDPARGCAAGPAPGRRTRPRGAPGAGTATASRRTTIGPPTHTTRPAPARARVAPSGSGSQICTSSARQVMPSASPTGPVDSPSTRRKAGCVARPGGTHLGVQARDPSRCPAPSRRR